MKALQITRKILLEALREPQLYGMLLLFPAALVLIYYVAFGATSQGAASILRIAIVNQDQGVWGERLIDAVRAATFDGKPVFQVAAADDSQSGAENSLHEGKLAMLVRIPSDFSRAVESERLDQANLETVGDRNSDLYAFANTFLSSVIDSFSDQITGWKQPSPIHYDFLANTGTLNDFQLGIPGLIIFGNLFLTALVAMLLVREETNGTLQRLHLAGVKGGSLIIGMTLAIIVVALIQMPIAYGTGILFGFRAQGNVFTALGICILLSLVGSGLGMLTACLAKSESEALILGMVFVCPLIFLSGAVFPLPEMPLGVIGGHRFLIIDVMPSTHAVVALQRVLLYGDTLQTTGFPVAVLAGMALITLAGGAWIYQRLKLANLAK